MSVNDGRPVFTFEGLRFGGIDTGVFVTEFDPGAGEVEHQDVQAPNSTYLLMGRDLPAPPAWTFELTTDFSSVDDALDRVSEMGEVWRSRKWREPSVTGKLFYSVGSRERYVVGRPRRFTYSDGGVHAQVGRADFMCDFQLSDPRSFGAGPGNTGETVLTLVPESTGGLIAPLVTPLTTTRRGGERAGVIRNPGDAPTPVVVTFHGPVANPKLYGVGWEIGLTGSLAYDEKITVDALGMSVRRGDGANVGGRLTRGTRLNNAALQPGEQEIWFTGADETGTAKAVVSWSAAYWSL